jgi:putative FmdB family regulatory protein
MPIYEYTCDDCGKNFERLVFGSEIPDCPSCDGKKVKKMMSTCGFLSKGAGGETMASSASAASACGSCSAGSCASCGH